MTGLERLFWITGGVLLLPFVLYQSLVQGPQRPLQPDAPQLQSMPAVQMHAAVAVADRRVLNMAHGVQVRPSLRDVNERIQNEPRDPGLVPPIARVAIPSLDIDQAVFPFQNRRTLDFGAELITTSSDLNIDSHIGLAMRLEGDAEAVAKRARGELLILRTERRLRQYRIIDARFVGMNMPRLMMSSREAGVVTLVNCVPAANETGEARLLVISALEVEGSQPLVQHGAKTANNYRTVKF